MEISKNEKENKAYVILSFDDENLPLEIYKINGENAGKKIREISNPNKKKCFSMNYYDDDLLSKCFIVCGFQDCVKSYDLSLDNWGSEFKTDGFISSLQIFTKKDRNKNNLLEIKHFLLFSTWNNSISLCDLSSSKVISKIVIPNTQFILDVCIWYKSNFEKESALIGCDNENSIKVMSNFKDLKLLLDCSKGTEPRPINFRKILIKDKTTGIFKEHLGVFLNTFQSTRKVILY